MTPKLEGITTIFFDLDGTLLDFDEEKFEKLYIGMVYEFFNDVDRETFFTYFWKATQQMMQHDDPGVTTLKAYLNIFCELSGFSAEEAEARFRKFYETRFGDLQELCRPTVARELIDEAKSKGLKLVLATNPVFPEISTQKRVKWAGISFDDFIHVSHADNSTVCKPNPRYYRELLDITGSEPAETLMVGNHYYFDMVASELGMKTWMLDQNREGKEYRDKFRIDFNGSLEKLLTEIRKL